MDAGRVSSGTGDVGDMPVTVVDFGCPTTQLTAGVYTFSTSGLLSGDLHFDGDASSIFIIQIAGNLIQETGKKVILEGVLAENIFWQVAGYVAVDTTAHMKGILVCMTTVTFKTLSSLDGRILAQKAAVLDSATITPPAD